MSLRDILMVKPGKMRSLLILFANTIFHLIWQQDFLK